MHKDEKSLKSMLIRLRYNDFKPILREAHSAVFKAVRIER